MPRVEEGLRRVTLHMRKFPQSRGYDLSSYSQRSVYIYFFSIKGFCKGAVHLHGGGLPPLNPLKVN